LAGRCPGPACSPARERAGGAAASDDCLPPRSPLAAPPQRKAAHKRSAAAAAAGPAPAAAERAPRRAQPRRARAERAPIVDSAGEDEGDGEEGVETLDDVLYCAEAGGLEGGALELRAGGVPAAASRDAPRAPRVPVVKPEWANPFEAAAEAGAGWPDRGGAVSPSPTPSPKRARARPPTRAARSATRAPRPSGRWAAAPLGGAGLGLGAAAGVPGRRTRSSAPHDAAAELEAAVFWRPAPAKRAARPSPLLSACQLLRRCDEGGCGAAPPPTPLAPSRSAPAACLGGLASPVPASPFLPASRLLPGEAGPDGARALPSGPEAPPPHAHTAVLPGSPAGPGCPASHPATPPPPPRPQASAERAPSLTFAAPAAASLARTPTLTPMRSPHAGASAAPPDLAAAAARLMRGSPGLLAGSPAPAGLATPGSDRVFSGLHASPSLSSSPASPVAVAALATCAALRERHDSEALRLQRSLALGAPDGAGEAPRLGPALTLPLPGSRLGKALASAAGSLGGSAGCARVGPASPGSSGGTGSAFARACSALRAPMERAASPAWGSGGFRQLPRSGGSATSLSSAPSAALLQQCAPARPPAQPCAAQGSSECSKACAHAAQGLSERSKARPWQRARP
jgi:hypothetical protein